MMLAFEPGFTDLTQQTMNTMRSQSIMLRTLTLLSCWYAASGQASDWFNLRGLERLVDERLFEGRLLQGRNPDEEPLPTCPGQTVDMFYDLNITIEAAGGDEEICTDNDFVNIGLILETVVAEIEEAYPAYSEEYLDTKLCPVPDITEDGEFTVMIKNDAVPPWLQDGGRRALASPTRRPTAKPTQRPAPRPTRKPTRKPTLSPAQKKKRYTYKSGGRCRRCKTDNAARRVLADTSNAEITQDEAVTRACSSADTAIFASQVAARALENCAKVVTEVVELAEVYNDKAEGQLFVVDVTELLEESKDKAFESRKAAEIAPDWCERAEDAADKPSLKDKTIEYMANAVAASDDALAAAKATHEVYRFMITKKLELKKLVLQQNFEKQRQELEELIQIERANKQMMEDQMEAQIILAEAQLTIAQDNATIEELEAKKATLEDMKREKDEKFAKMSDEIKNMETMYLEQLEFQIEEANILLALEGASNVDEWLQHFADLCEHVIPDELYKEYNIERKNPRGCLVVAPNVTVVIDQRDSWADTYKAKCDLSLI